MICEVYDLIREVMETRRISGGYVTSGLRVPEACALNTPFNSTQGHIY